MTTKTDRGQKKPNYSKNYLYACECRHWRGLDYIGPTKLEELRKRIAKSKRGKAGADKLIERMEKYQKHIKDRDTYKVI